MWQSAGLYCVHVTQHPIERNIDAVHYVCFNETETIVWH